MSSPIHHRQIAGTRWDPDLYLKFSDHRLRPALELLGRVPSPAPQLIYDLGCGPGNITQIIAERWPDATIYGLDNSPQMLAQAAAISTTIQWIEADIHSWSPAAAPDLIYSNATLQWVEGHQAHVPRLLSFLPPGGVLAVQMPLSWGAPSHRLMRETLANGGPGGSALGSAELRDAVAREWVQGAAVYYDLLSSASTLDIWETEYLQVLAGPDPVLEWVKATGLRPILNGLGDEERQQFLDEYTQRLRVAYPMRADGRTLYPFRRLFMVATV